MKKAFLALLVVALVATASNAAVLSMKWAGTDDAVIDMAASDSAVIEVWVDLASADDLINYFGANESAPDVLQTGVTTGITGWIDASVGGLLGAPGQQVSVGTPGATNPISGGMFLIAEQTVHLEGTATLDDMIDITFDHASVGLLDGTGAAYTFGPNLAGVVPHFYDYGLGSPGVADGGLGGSDRNPLGIHVIVPEPASFALLALGGIALLRRR
jgi:hypothetical protein